jgi:O-antigen/teichoic acid export membrane protein
MSPRAKRATRAPERHLEMRRGVSTGGVAWRHGTLAWLLVAVSASCLAGLQLALLQGIERWEPLPLALALYGAMATATFAHGLSWRRGGTVLHWAAALATYVATLSWLYTWFEPLQDLRSWARQLIVLWLDNGLGP